MPHKIPFRVMHVSGQDESFKAIELNTHHPSSKGWQSAKFCLYPQDIVVYLDQRTRLRKIQILSHQYLIATKIEFFIGDIPEGIPHSLQNARYTRLGYVALSDNEKTHFRARELKSVHVDAIGVYLKLVVHKNYINKHNLYNQVGLIAVNVIGDEISNPYDIQTRIDEKNMGTEKPDYISPLDDLAFDMYQDPEVAEKIRQLERKKQMAVLQERFDYAKRLRDAINYLQQVGEKLGKLDVEKRQAIENEDYERAKLKKIQIDEQRLRVFKELEIASLLEDNMPMAYQPPPPVAQRQSPQPPPQVPSPRPTLAPPRQVVDPEDRPLPALKPKTTREEVLPAPCDDEPGDPEHMTERDLRQAASVIDVFGLHLVSKAYSKTWSHREDALLEVYKRLNELPTTTDKEDMKAMFRAAVFLVQRGMKDGVFAVFRAALNLNKLLLVEFAERHNVQKPEMHFGVEKVVPPLLSRTGDTATRIRDLAKAYVLDMSQWQQVWNFQCLYTECLKPFPTNTMDRFALSRTELTADLYATHGLGHHHFSLESLMQFSSQALQHRAGEVREAAENMIIRLYEAHHKETVRSYLPPDDQSTRKNPLYKRLFDKFDRIDGKTVGGPVDTARDRDPKREIEKLQAELQELRDMAGVKGKSTTPRSKAGGPPSQAGKSDKSQPPGQGGKKQPASGKPKPSQAGPGPEPALEDPLVNLEKTCIFCGERNETFTEEGLDIHYWKNCPMLRRCANCKQVVEIATLTEHLLEECDAKGNFGRCPRCNEAVPKPELQGHINEAACNPIGPGGTARCPLCHSDVPASEESWKQHLMGADGCAQNPRRLAALHKETGGGAAPKNQGNGNRKKSQLPQAKKTTAK